MKETEFFARLKKSPHPVVVDFWAPWCGPCHMIEPAIKKLGQDYTGQVDVWKVNADESQDLLRKLKIFGIPTLVTFKDGQEVTRRTGAASPAVLAGLFEAALTGVKPVPAGLMPRDRILRLVIALVLGFLAYQGHFSGGYILLGALAAVVAFSAFYDRCPIYKMVSSRLRDWLLNKTAGSSQS